MGKAEDRKGLLQKALGWFQLPSGSIRRLNHSVSDAHGQVDIVVSNAAVNPTFGPTLEVWHDDILVVSL